MMVILRFTNFFLQERQNLGIY